MPYMGRDSPWLNCKAKIEQQLTLILLSDSSDHCYWSFLCYIFILLFISLNISSFLSFPLHAPFNLLLLSCNKASSNTGALYFTDLALNLVLFLVLAFDFHLLWNSLPVETLVPDLIFRSLCSFDLLIKNFSSS